MHGQRDPDATFEHVTAGSRCAGAVTHRRRPAQRAIVYASSIQERAVSTTHRIAVLSAVVALLGLSGCVWERGMGRGGYGDQRSENRRGDHNSDSQRDRRDRDGRPCDQRGQEGDRRHDDDCRPSDH